MLTPFLLPLLGLVVTFGLGWSVAMLLAKLEAARGLLAKREGSLVADGAQGVLGFIGGPPHFSSAF